MNAKEKKEFLSKYFGKTVSKVKVRKELKRIYIWFEDGSKISIKEDDPEHGNVYKFWVNNDPSYLEQTQEQEQEQEQELVQEEQNNENQEEQQENEEQNNENQEEQQENEQEQNEQEQEIEIEEVRTNFGQVQGTGK